MTRNKHLSLLYFYLPTSPCQVCERPPLAEAVAATRRELALATGSFAAATSALATTEDSNNLSKALSNLAIVEEKVEKVQHRQADADHLHLFELIKDYVGLMGAVRDALTERQKAFQVCSFFLTVALICFDFVTKKSIDLIDL